MISTQDRQVSVKEPAKVVSPRSETDKVSCLAVRKPGTRRKNIPERPNYSINLWSIMKNSIGRDLSKIPMPVSSGKSLSCLFKQSIRIPLFQVKIML